jgi:hypothetical protein
MKIVRFGWNTVTSKISQWTMVVMVFNATFNNISVTLSRQVLMVEETGVSGLTNLIT